MDTSIVMDTNIQIEKRTIYKEPGPLGWKELGRYNKLILSILYFIGACFIHAITLVFANNRVPHSGKNPPLPDIFLDNISYIPWAFAASEKLMVFLFSMMLVILVFHKYRFVVLRRGLVLIASTYLLRCATMGVTALPTPGEHITCQPKVNYTFWPMAKRVSGIMISFGMTIVDQRSTCGDYIYSGHAAMLTIISFSLRKYTPSRFYPLHILTWICNLVGMFLILASHEHYTVDVLLSFYIVQQLFNSYHVLAHYKSIHQSDCWTGIWRPLFLFFESDGDGVVPNEFEIPLPGLNTLQDIVSPKYK